VTTNNYSTTNISNYAQVSIDRPFGLSPTSTRLKSISLSKWVTVLGTVPGSGKWSGDNVRLLHPELAVSSTVVCWLVW